MPTDDERREVARRLREYVDLPDDWWQETCAEFYVEKCVFGNVDRHSEAELFTRLADLIEPDDPPYNLYTLYETVLHRSPRCWECIEDDEVDELVDALLDICNSSGHECIQRPQPSCDRDALLALADECDSVHIHKVARRIREACGEVA